MTLANLSDDELLSSRLGRFATSRSGVAPPEPPRLKGGGSIFGRPTHRCSTFASGAWE